jgi:hypothetical protein
MGTYVRMDTKGVTRGEFVETPSNCSGRFTIIITVPFLVIDRHEKINAICSAYINLQGG